MVPLAYDLPGADFEAGLVFDTPCSSRCSTGPARTRCSPASSAPASARHADKLHGALVALMFCANCGRPLEDPQSVNRGIGPDCWGRIDPAWRSSIEARTGHADVLLEVANGDAP